MSQKQIAQAVVYGRKITFWPLDGEPIIGYVCGWDDDYYSIVEPHPEGGFKHQLIHKAGTPVIELHREQTYDDEEEDVREQMERIVHPFRRWIMTNILNERPSASTTAR